MDYVMKTSVAIAMICCLDGVLVSTFLKLF